MIDLDPQSQDEARCPKRLWVMLALSDDELIDGQVSLPLGLRLHLAQCDSCRALSQRLLGVSGGLERLAADEPRAGLIAEANGRLESALDAMPVPHSRPADNAVGTSRGGLANAHVARGMGVVRYAAAAVVAVAVAVFLPVLWYGGGTGDEAGRRAESPGGAPDSWRMDASPADDDPLRASMPETVSPGPDEEPGAPDARPGLAQADAPASRQPARKPRICTFDAFGSPAGPDDATCIYRGFQLPRRQEPSGKRR